MILNRYFVVFLSVKIFSLFFDVNLEFNKISVMLINKEEVMIVLINFVDEFYFDEKNKFLSSDNIDGNNVVEKRIVVIGKFGDIINICSLNGEVVFCIVSSISKKSNV